MDIKDSGSTLMSEDKDALTATLNTTNQSPTPILNQTATGGDDVVNTDEESSNDASEPDNFIDQIHQSIPESTAADGGDRTWYAQGTPQANLRNMIEGAKNPAHKARLEERLKRREPRAAERYARREVRAEGIHQKHDPQGYQQGIEDEAYKAKEAKFDKNWADVPARVALGEIRKDGEWVVDKSQTTKPVKELKPMKSSFTNNKISLREQGDMDRLSPLWNTKI